MSDDRHEGRRADDGRPPERDDFWFNAGIGLLVAGAVVGVAAWDRVGPPLTRLADAATAAVAGWAGAVVDAVTGLL